MLNRFFIFNGIQTAAVYKAAPYAKPWYRFNSQLIFGHVARETSVFNKAACPPALLSVTAGEERPGEAEETVDTEHPILWFLASFFPFLK